MPPGFSTACRLLALCLALATPIAAHAKTAGQAWDDGIAITPPTQANTGHGQPRLVLTSFTAPTPPPIDSAIAGAPIQTGFASWYGRHWAGRRTASGIRFNPNAMTAASPTLPLGTRVLVTLVSTARSVLVTITDRQRTGHRIIDLSHEAARRLGLLGAGVAKVVVRHG